MNVNNDKMFITSGIFYVKTAFK